MGVDAHGDPESPDATTLTGGTGSRVCEKRGETMSKKIHLTRRKVIISLVVIGVAAAFAGAGTMAFFSDTETSSNNTVSAGTLDMKVNGGDEKVQLLSATNAVPGDTGSNSTKLKNTGSINGSYDVNLSNTLQENGWNEPENDSAAEKDGSVELGSQLNVTVGIDNDRDGDIDNVAYQGPVADAEGHMELNETLTAGETDRLIVRYEIPTDAGNEIQSDGALLNVTVNLEQPEAEE